MQDTTASLATWFSPEEPRCYYNLQECVPHSKFIEITSSSLEPPDLSSCGTPKLASSPISLTPYLSTAASSPCLSTITKRSPLQHHHYHQTSSLKALYYTNTNHGYHHGYHHQPIDLYGAPVRLSSLSEQSTGYRDVSSTDFDLFEHPFQCLQRSFSVPTIQITHDDEFCYEQQSTLSNSPPHCTDTTLFYRENNNLQHQHNNEISLNTNEISLNTNEISLNTNFNNIQETNDDRRSNTGKFNPLLKIDQQPYGSCSIDNDDSRIQRCVSSPSLLVIPPTILNLELLERKARWESSLTNAQDHSFSLSSKDYMAYPSSDNIAERLTLYLLYLGDPQNQNKEDNSRFTIDMTRRKSRNLLHCDGKKYHDTFHYGAFEIFETHGQSVEGFENFIERLSVGMSCSHSCFVLAGIYLNRLLTINPKLKLTPTNMAKLFFTAVVLAVKYLDDSFFTNQYYARVCGDVDAANVKKMEILFMSAIDYRLFVTSESYCAAEIIQATLIESLMRRGLTVKKVFPQLPLSPKPLLSSTPVLLQDKAHPSSSKTTFRIDSSNNLLLRSQNFGCQRAHTPSSTTRQFNVHEHSTNSLYYQCQLPFVHPQSPNCWTSCLVFMPTVSSFTPTSSFSCTNQSHPQMQTSTVLASMAGPFFCIPSPISVIPSYCFQLSPLLYFYGNFMQSTNPTCCTLLPNFSSTNANTETCNCCGLQYGC